MLYFNIYIKKNNNNACNLIKIKVNYINKINIKIGLK